MQLLLKTLFATLALTATWAHAAPDEDRLGKAQGYPVGTPANYLTNEAMRVGSFSQMHKVPFKAIYPVTLKASAAPLPLPPHADASAFASRLRWRIDGASYTVDDYLARQRTMGLMVLKDGKVLLERYQYDRKPEHTFLSNSMAKSIASLAFGLALQDGLIASLDARADALEPALKGSLYGQATVRQLLNMASGVRYTEVYDGKDDHARFMSAATLRGIPAAAQLMDVREAPAGERFKYASSETAVLSQLFQAAVKQDIASYLSAKLWQPLGAARDAFWYKNNFGVVNAAGGFNATLQDYARLGAVLANDGARPDTGAQVVPKAYLLDATDWRKQAAAFQPRVATPYFGYGSQFWHFPSQRRMFAMLGIHGQAIFIDPAQQLVMVHVSANETASAGKTTLGRELDALWRGVVGHYGRWD